MRLLNDGFSWCIDTSETHALKAAGGKKRKKRGEKEKYRLLALEVCLHYSVVHLDCLQRRAQV